MWISAYKFDNGEPATQKALALACLFLHVCPAQNLCQPTNATKSEVRRTLDWQIARLGCIKATIDPGKLAIARL